MKLISELKEDYRRHGSSASNLAFWALATYRFGRWTADLPAPARALGSKLYGVMTLLVEMTSGIVLHRQTQIGQEFHLVHAGNIQIHPRAKIGDRVGIMHDVTIGTAMERDDPPIIGDDVFIGAGAKILGPVTIGDRARIAANSLVITDVPADTTAIGVPAKVMRYTGRPAPVPDASAPERVSTVQPIGSGRS